MADNDNNKEINENTLNDVADGKITVKSIPNQDNIVFKQGFVERYSQLTDFNAFKDAALKFLRRSIRVNTLKISVKELKSRLENDWILEEVPWCKEGFFIEHRGEGDEKRRDVGNLVEHALGYVYIQEAASMIPPIVLNPLPNELVLDMCAAPGSKTTQIAAMMQNKGIIIANDYKGIRLAPLSLNVQRMGITNCIITLTNGQGFKKKGIMFDKILVDAPCSGTGTIGKSLKTLRIWNPKTITKLARTQKQLIETAFNILKPGGVMVYSTCSLEPEENEGVISYLLNKFDNAETMPIELNIKRSKPITEFNNELYHEDVKHCLRLWPQDNFTEGFFVCKIRKKE